MARSRNRGESWTIHEVVRSDDPPFYPYLAARGAGILAAIWFEGRMEGYHPAGKGALMPRVGRFIFKEQEPAEPEVSVSPPLLTRTFGRSEKPPARTVGGDYVPVIVLSDGSIGAVTPVMDPDEERGGFTFWRFAP